MGSNRKQTRSCPSVRAGWHWLGTGHGESSGVPEMFYSIDGYRAANTC